MKATTKSKNSIETQNADFGTEDPVCGMTVDKRTALHAQREGQTYYFCCERCREKFLSGEAPQASADAQRCCCGSSHAKTTKPKGRRFGFYWLLVSAAVAVPVLVGCSKSKAESPVPKGAPAPEVEVQKVAKRSIPLSFEFTGHSVAAHHVEVKPRVSGYVINAPFTEGSLVEAGSPLFEIDARPFVAKHAQAEADVARAQAAADLARQELARAERLGLKDAIAKEELERRRADLQTASAALSAAVAQREVAALDLEFAKVRAPVSGRVGRALVKPGNLVSGGDATATLLTTLVTVSPMQVLFNLDEPAYQQLIALRAAGKTIQAEVRLGRYEKIVAGEIDYLGNRLDSRSGTAEARVVIPNTDGHFAPGLFARITIVAEADKPRLLVPEKALGSEQGSRFVLVVGANNKLVHRRVSLGERRGDERLVMEGLSAGELIVINGLQRLRPGMTVQPVEASMARN